MYIESFVIAWNEERLIQQYIDWYKPFVDNITVIDNYSTDNTVDIAVSNNCTIKKYGDKTQNNLLMKQAKEACWKNSKADWVIVGDMDEFLYSENLLKILENINATIVKPFGYQMVSEKFAPVETVKTGTRDQMLDKCILFKPRSIVDINYDFGCHNAKPTGNVIYYHNDDIKLFHYSYLGRENWKARCRRYRDRMSKWDLDNGAGTHYLWSDEQMNAYFDSLLNNAKVVF